YQQILSRYFFIGIAEYLRESIDRLAELLNKRSVKLSVLNKSRRDSQAVSLPIEILNQFKTKNQLDYRIYEYCLKKFRENP
ncbi:MAG: hypothetical protein JSV88_11685, partial [Candidatus Aminicenantes bacterium]